MIKAPSVNSDMDALAVFAVLTVDKFAAPIACTGAKEHRLPTQGGAALPTARILSVRVMEDEFGCQIVLQRTRQREGTVRAASQYRAAAGLQRKDRRGGSASPPRNPWLSR